MNRKLKAASIVCILAAAAFPAGCAAIPREDVPVGWSLDVHQPGAWWTQPLIPRAVVVQRCPPPLGWVSNPDLTQVTGLPPGSSVEYSFVGDDYHCLIGWSQPASEVTFTPDEMTTEAGLRRICSSSGLPMDSSWRFLGYQPSETAGVQPGAGEPGLEDWAATTAAFADDDTVVGCLVEYQGQAGASAFVELSVGADAATGGSACPVGPRDLKRGDDGTLEEYRLRGAGAVRDDAGRLLTEATTLQIGVAGDSVTTSHPVVDGMAIVDAWARPTAPVHFDWDKPPAVEGQVLGPDGNVLATCRG